MSNTDREFDEAVRYGMPLAQQKGNIDSIDDGFLQIFSSPEYRKRREDARRTANEANSQQQQDSQTIGHRISNVNIERFQKKERFSLVKHGLVVVAILVLGFLAMIFSHEPASEKEASTYVPAGYVRLLIAEEVSQGDTVYSIASKYYNSDAYSTAYGSLNDYVDAIIDTNNLSYDGDIEPYDVLAISVLVDVDNEHYQELKRLEHEIAKITQEEYWVDYVVKPGDSLSSIAAKASGSTVETIELTKKIMAKNDLSSSLIYDGQHLKTVNPKLGQLKIQFNAAKEALQKSLKVGNSITK